ncbi:MAG: carboxypeptidase-like regulatory domain-containing protein [Chitinophagaceae bacterium]|nr:carboxypeptidase-like regulatory domain-containing protein [Chitinophagaceae bacterium]
MKKNIAALATIFISAIAFAQSTSFNITGKIIDATTKAPMLGASVFAQNTTLGTATGADGMFTLWLPNGGYDLVVTFTGYETVSRRITTADAVDRNMVIELKQKEKAMEEVSIKSSNEIKDGLAKYGDFFMENFIGKTINSKQCVIINKEALKFYFSKKRNRLKILTSEPLEIENTALGYKIKYTLDSFTHDYTTQVSTFTGYPLFEEMQTADLNQAAAWKANRIAAYKGSILHFMRSTYNQQLKEEGFEIQFIVKNNDADTAIKGLNFYAALNYSRDDSTKLVEISPNQPNVAVLYKNELPGKDYTDLNEDAPKKFELSIITIPVMQAIGIEQNGFYYDQNDIGISGYWSWEKVADMLPYDFKAE